MFEDNHYQVLQVDREASQADVKLAYRRLVKQFHPDIQPSQRNIEKTIRINAAYEVLGDPQRRRAYDRELESAALPRGRERRRADAQDRFRRERQSARQEDLVLQQWMGEVYEPIDAAIARILDSVEGQLDDLAADPFDDRLMESFEAYLDDCREAIARARQLFSSRSSPAGLAGVVADLYRSLNQVGDGLEDFVLFTRNYDDRYLHEGCELLRIAEGLLWEVRTRLNARR